MPTLLDGAPVEIMGYPIATVLAEKLCTAVQLGQANTRIRDYVDLYKLTGTHAVRFRQAQDALLATARYRGVDLRPLSVAVGELATIRTGAYRSYRSGLGTDGTDLPDSLTELIFAVIAFADPLLDHAPHSRWDPATRVWT